MGYRSFFLPFLGMFVGSENPNCFSLACLSAAEMQKAETHYKRKTKSELTDANSASAELFWVFPQAAGSRRESGKVSYLTVIGIYLTLVLMFVYPCSTWGSVAVRCDCACSQSIKMNREGYF